MIEVKPSVNAKISIDGVNAIDFEMAPLSVKSVDKIKITIQTDLGMTVIVHDATQDYVNNLADMLELW